SEIESPALLIPVAGIRMACWAGKQERPEFLRQNALLANIWTGLGADISAHEAEGRNHFTIVADLADPDSAMTGRWLDAWAARHCPHRTAGRRPVAGWRRPWPARRHGHLPASPETPTRPSQFTCAGQAGILARIGRKSGGRNERRSGGRTADDGCARHGA